MKTIIRYSIHSHLTLILVACLFACFRQVADAGDPGIVIEPDKDDLFEYIDDFSSPRFLRDIVAGNVSAEAWSPGQISHQGPGRNRELVYRFKSDRAISGFEIEIEQASSANLGGRTNAYISANGLDWRRFDSSRGQDSVDHWQKEPFVVSGEDIQAPVGQSELWLRIVMDNFSGLETRVSNRLEKLNVTIETEDKTEAEEIEDDAAAVSRIFQQAGHQAIILDVADIKRLRSPHYFEKADGWLLAAEEMAEDAEGLMVKRGFRDNGPPRLSLAVFADVEQPAEQLATRITVQRGRETSRELNVLWNDKVVETIDTARFFERRQSFDVILPGPIEPGLNELRLQPVDDKPAIIRAVTIAGSRSLNWTSRPPMERGEELTVLSAQYLPDFQPPADSQVNKRGMYERHREFGALRVNLKNPGPEPVRISGLELNGRPVEDSYVDFVESDWDARGVVWYRINPRTLQPGECAEVYIRFRQRPEGEQAELAIHTENAGTIFRDIAYDEPDIRIDYVTTDQSRRRLIAYIKPYSEKSVPVTVDKVHLDGVPLANAEIFDADMEHGVTVVTAELDQPLQVGDYHTFGARTAEGNQFAAEFRTLLFEFIRSSIHIDPAKVEEMHMNLLMWNLRNLETCEKYDVDTTTRPHTRIFDVHERVAYVYGPDEPDAFQDNVGGGHARGLGSAARRLAEARQWEMTRRFLPGRPWWTIINATTVPLNWSVYGQMTDIMAYDPYPTTYFNSDHTYVRESLRFSRMAGAPRRLIACLEAFTRRGRTPIGEEYRQNVVQSIGSGAKGLTSWVYPARHRGWSDNPELIEAISSMNRLVSNIEDKLLLATPVNWATTDAGTVMAGMVGEEKWEKERVWAGALLAGTDTIIVAVANHIPASHPEPPEITAAENVTVTINLPDYITDVSAGEVTEKGIIDFPKQITDGEVTLNLPSITDGRIFVLRSQ